MKKTGAVDTNGRPLTKSRERVKKHAEVFTPEWMVKKMCDLLERENPGCYDLEKTFLEPCCGDGNFLVEIFARKLACCVTPEDGKQALSTIYGVDIQMDNVVESRRRMYEMYKERFGESNQAVGILERNIICDNFLTMNPETAWEQRDNEQGGDTDE